MRIFITKLTKLCIFISLIAVFFLVFAKISKIYKIQTIEIEGLDKKESLAGINELKNINIFLLDSDKTKEAIVKNNPIIKEMVLYKKYPNKIELIVVKNQVVALFKANSGYFYLSENARIINKKKELTDNYPIINYYQKIDYASTGLGSKLTNKDITFSLDGLLKCRNLGLEIISIDIMSLNMIGFNLKGKKILFSLDKDKASQFYELETIIKQFRAEGKDFSTLDLRFEKPVMVK